VRIARSERPEVNRKLLLTGRPGSGKTTLIKRIVNKIEQAAGGFYTVEIRERGERIGFKIVTIDGKEAVFAHVNFDTPERLGKYGLDLSALEHIAIEAIRAAVRARQLIVIDEIGPMEIRSQIFCEAVTEAFDAGMPIVATITARSFPFTDAIKKRADVTIIEVRPSNRDQLVSELSDQFMA
jgi:nucleoside-triphosphatase